jgi:hypothetical protein
VELSTAFNTAELKCRVFMYDCLILLVDSG